MAVYSGSRVARVLVGSRLSQRSYIHQKFTKVKEFPPVLNLLLTNEDEVWQETIKDDQGEIIEYRNTFVCMNQYDCSTQKEYIKELLDEYLDLDLSSDVINDRWLYDIASEFLNFVQSWYSSKKESLTSEDVRCAIADFVLKKFMINPKQSRASTIQKLDIEQSPDLRITERIETIINDYSLIVVNHRFYSTFKTNIWKHMVPNMDKLSEKELIDLWREGKIHVPLQSEEKDTDKLILKAMDIRKFNLKAIIFRYVRFSIECEEEIMVSLLHNLPESGYLSVPEKETLAYSIVGHNLLQDLNLKLHRNSFCNLLKESSTMNFPEMSVIEALDEPYFVNEFHHHGDDEYAISAIHACLRIPHVDVDTISKLLRMGATIDIAIHGGITPVLATIELEREDILEFLLKNGADTELANRDSDTALHVACKKKNVRLAQLLIKYNADKEALNKIRKNPFEAVNDPEFERLCLAVEH